MKPSISFELRVTNLDLLRPALDANGFEQTIVNGNHLSTRHTATQQTIIVQDGTLTVNSRDAALLVKRLYAQTILALANARFVDLGVSEHQWTAEVCDNGDLRLRCDDRTSSMILAEYVEVLAGVALPGFHFDPTSNAHLKNYLQRRLAPLKL